MPNLTSHYIAFPQPKTIEVREEIVTPPEPNEILCAAEKSLISIGTEMNCLRGEAEPGTNWAEWLQYPFRPGYSMAGRVLEVGREIKGVKAGDRIAAPVTHQQFFKLTSHAAQKAYDAPAGASFFHVPDRISSEDATWRGLACTTQNAVRRGQFQFGESVGVVGLGILGQLITQYLALAGARRIVVIDPVASRLEMAKRNGATHTLQLDVKNAVEPIRDLTDGWMLDLVFDVTGHPSTLAPTTQLLRKLGRLVLVGDTPMPTQQHLGPGVLSNSISILAIHGFMVPEQATVLTPWSIEEMGNLFFDYVEQGKMNVADLVTHRYSPLQAPEVYSGLLKDRSSAVGILFDWAGLG